MDKYCSTTASLRKFEEQKFNLSFNFGTYDSFLASAMSHYFISSSSLLIIHILVYYRLVCLWFSDDYNARVILFCALLRPYGLTCFYLHTVTLNFYSCAPCVSIMFADWLDVSRIYCILTENDMGYLIIKLTLNGLEKRPETISQQSKRFRLILRKKQKLSCHKSWNFEATKIHCVHLLMVCPFPDEI